jgi:hypothetical protein
VGIRIITMYHVNSLYVNCLSHSLAGIGLGVVLDKTCDRIYKTLIKPNIKDQWLGSVMALLMQLYLFVVVTSLDIVYTPHVERGSQAAMSLMFMKSMLFGTQFGFFERLQSVTKSV